MHCAEVWGGARMLELLHWCLEVSSERLERKSPTLWVYVALELSIPPYNLRLDLWQTSSLKLVASSTQSDGGGVTMCHWQSTITCSMMFKRRDRIDSKTQSTTPSPPAAVEVRHAVWTLAWACNLRMMRMGANCSAIVICLTPRVFCSICLLQSA